MGFKISWLAFFGKEKTDVLASMHLVDTGIHEEAIESPICAASFPKDWTVLFLNEFLHPLTEDPSLETLSKDCTVICGQVHEGIMYSSACLYERGTLLWSVSHDAQTDLYNLEIEGELPESFADIKKQCVVQQDNAGGKTAGVDYMFNVPVDLAKSICGFEYCRWRYDWGEPHFTELKKV